MSWDPLSEEDSLGFRITYLVRYRVHEFRVTRSTEDTSTIVEVTESSMTISDLEPQLAYAVAVAAKNEMGAGEFSKEITVDSECIAWLRICGVFLLIFVASMIL